MYRNSAHNVGEIREVWFEYAQIIVRLAWKSFVYRVQVFHDALDFSARDGKLAKGEKESFRSW
jgi:hypothetical protein